MLRGRSSTFIGPLLPLGIAVLLLWSALGCKQESFKGGGAPRPSDAPVQTPDLAVSKAAGPVEKFSAGGNQSSVPVDLIFVMDTSGSMKPKQPKLEVAMQSLVTRFLSTAANVDYQIFLVGKNFNFPTNIPQGKVGLVNVYVDSYNALDISSGFLLGRYTANIPLRKLANKELVIITDDEAKIVDAAVFRSLVAPAKETIGKLHVHGIIGLSPVGTQDCNVESVGVQYQQLSNDPEYRGLLQDVCAPDWGPLIDNLALKVIETKAQTKYLLQLGRPKNPQSISVAVNGAVLPAGAYTYSAAENAIVFPDTLAPPSGSAIEVMYN